MQRHPTETWDIKQDFHKEVMAKLIYEKLAGLSQSNGIMKDGVGGIMGKAEEEYFIIENSLKSKGPLDYEVDGKP